MAWRQRKSTRYVRRAPDNAFEGAITTKASDGASKQCLCLVPSFIDNLQFVVDYLIRNRRLEDEATDLEKSSHLLDT